MLQCGCNDTHSLFRKEQKMTVKVNFVNNDNIIINSDTRIIAFKSIDNTDEQPGYYANRVVNESREDGNLLATSDPLVALQGLFGSVDWFSLSDKPSTFYKTSSIFSLEII